MVDVKYPDIEVQLSGRDGNPMMIVARVVEALRKARVPKSDIDEFREEAMSGDYDRVIQTCMRWVDVT